MISNITHRCAAKHRDELPSPHAFLKPKDYNLPHRMEAIVRHSKMACSTSALGQKQTFRTAIGMSALPPIATSIAFFGMSALGRFCCISPLRSFLVSDSVAVRRFATGAGYDEAADSRPGTVFLFISSR